MHRFQHRIFLVCNAFRVGIGQNRNGVIANHTPVLVAIMRPNGQQSVNALLAVFQHRSHHIGIALRLQKIEQRM